jgi:hypothetical protein
MLMVIFVGAKIGEASPRALTVVPAGALTLMCSCTFSAACRYWSAPKEIGRAHV